MFSLVIELECLELLYFWHAVSITVLDTPHLIESGILYLYNNASEVTLCA